MSAPSSKFYGVRNLTENVTEGTHEIVGRGTKELRVPSLQSSETLLRYIFVLPHRETVAKIIARRSSRDSIIEVPHNY